MDRNPYAPPTAPVNDPAAAVEAPMDRPRTVTLAVRLMWVSMVIGALNLIFGWNDLMAMDEIAKDAPANALGVIKAVVVVMLVISFAFYSWVIVKMGQGRNWARVVLVILMALSLLSNPFSGIPKLGVLLGLMGVVTFALELASLVLIYMPASRPWFQPRKTG